MKPSLKIHKKIRYLFAHWNLFQFQLKKRILGFDTANQFIQRVDKQTLQLILRKNGATIGNDCDIETGLIFHNCRNYSNLIVGDNCHIGKNCFFDLRDKIEIGNNVVISMQCTFITHIDMNKSHLKTLFPAEHGPIKINNDVYIGTNSTILMDIHIGEKSLVAAGSLINRNVAKETMVGGVPARKIK